MPNEGLKVEPRTTQPDRPCTPYRARKPKPDMSQSVRNVRGAVSRVDFGNSVGVGVAWGDGLGIGDVVGCVAVEWETPLVVKRGGLTLNHSNGLSFLNLTHLNGVSRSSGSRRSPRSKGVQIARLPYTRKTTSESVVTRTSR